MPPTKSRKGANRASASSTLLRPLSSQVGRIWNIRISSTAPPQKVPQPTVRLLQTRPTSTAMTTSAMLKMMKAMVLPVVKRVWMSSIR